MKWLFKTFTFFSFLMIFGGLFLNFKENIITFYNSTIEYFSHDKLYLEKNEYYREYDFMFLRNAIDLRPRNYQDIINIFYTIINSGKESFSFYCPKEYVECISDVKEVVDDETLLSDINNFVHPFNSFKNIEIECGSFGEITLNIDKTYSESDILEISEKVNFISNSILNNTDSESDSIRKVHDYIINNSKYDTPRVEKGIDTYKSDSAYGVLLQGYGICSGYTDAMQLFLENMDIKNYRISSGTHVWNAVLIDGVWKHLDLTWDDPVMSNGSDFLDDTFFLITTEELLNQDVTEHNFNQNVYLELKNNS